MRRGLNMSVAMLLWLAPGAVGAQTIQRPAGTPSCAFHAYVVDADGKTNVRATPSARAAVIGTLPAARKQYQSPDEGAQVEVIAAKDGFFLIENANVADIETADESRKLGPWHRGRGWVHGSRLGFFIQSGDGLRASPDANAPVTLRFPIGEGEPAVVVTALHACRAGNVEASLNGIDGKALGRGWIVPGAKTGAGAPVTICASQLTTCN